MDVSNVLSGSHETELFVLLVPTEENIICSSPRSKTKQRRPTLNSAAVLNYADSRAKSASLCAFSVLTFMCVFRRV